MIYEACPIKRRRATRAALAALDDVANQLEALAAAGDERAGAALAELVTDDAADRDKLIRDMAEKHASQFWSINAKAKHIDLVARRYETTAWPRHRDCLRAPPEISGKPEEFVYRVLKSTGSFPGYSRLRTILTNR